MFAHFRPIVVAFLSLALGIWFAELFRQGQIFYFAILTSVLVFISLLSLFYFLRPNKFFSYLWKNLKFILTFLSAFLIGFGSFTLLSSNVSKEQNVQVDSNATYVIMGEVRFAPVEYETYMSMFIDNISLSDDTSTLNLGEQGMYVKIDTENISDDSPLFTTKAGDTILLVGSVKNVDVFSKNSLFSYAYKNNFRYMAYSDSDEISVISGTQSGIDSVRQYIKDIIYGSMSERNAGLAYALFVGDVSGLDFDMQVNFQKTGIAHLLAVSGLNTALMAMVLMWIFKRCRIKPAISVIIIALFLAFYCVICNFCPSVMRASLMSVFLLLGQAFGKQSDNLNSVSLAGIILLLVSPMYLFDLSFLLSFASVFGIFLLYPLFEKALLKMRLGQFVSSTLALSIAAQIGTLPLIINTFGYVSVISLLVNFLVVPFMGYVYIAMFVCLLLTMIFPFMWWGLWLCQWGLWLVDVVSAWFAGWSFATVQTEALASIFLVFFFVALFCFSRFCVITKRKPRIALYLSVLIIGVLLLIANHTIFPLL